MDEFSLMSDRSVLLQGRGMFAADGYLGIRNSSGVLLSEGKTAVPTQHYRKNKGKDLFYCDWPELDGFEDLETSLRNFDPTFEIGSKYFEDSLWSSVCSPEAQLAPSSYFDNVDFSIDQNERQADPILSVSVPDATSAKPSFIDQINMKKPSNIEKQSRNKARDHTPLNREAHASSSSGEIDQFSQHSDPELFCPFDDFASAKQIGGCEGLEAILCSRQGMRVPTASSTVCNDEPAAPSSACSGTELVATQIPRSVTKPHDPLRGTPDMILEELAENPLEIYFPPLTTHEPETTLMSDNTSAQTYHFPEEFAGSGVPYRAGLQFRLEETTTSEELIEQPSPMLVLEAVPVKDLGFQKLQEGMNLLDLATKGHIRDALYRLANCVEQRHCAVGTSAAVGSSGSKRLKSGRWIETQMNPVDQSVAQLLLQKPLFRKTVLPHRVT